MWKDLVNYQGLYEVSDDGQIRSVDRMSYNGKRNLKGKLILQSIDEGGYYKVTIFKDNKRKTFTVHLLVFDTFSQTKRKGRELQVDHIDNDKSNNNITNLQVLTNRQNNSKKTKVGTSKHIGVSFTTQNNKWRAEIYKDGKTKFLGYFINEQDASSAYQKEL